MKKAIITLSAVISFFWVGSVQAAQWEVDKGHAEVRFEIQHIFSTITGQFLEFDGKITFDPQNADAGNISFVVKTKSINTNNNKRDTHLRSKDFFEVDKFPEMKFVSSGISHVKDSTYNLEGDLTIKGVKKPIKVNFEFFGPTTHPFNKKSVAGFETRFELNRLDYEVGTGKFLKLGVVQDRVSVLISFEALKK